MNDLWYQSENGELLVLEGGRTSNIKLVRFDVHGNEYRCQPNHVVSRQRLFNKPYLIILDSTEYRPIDEQQLEAFRFECSLLRATHAFR